MKYIFKFPDIGEGISEGKILAWYVQKGQHIKGGQPLVKMETDKVVTDIPAPREGIISAIFSKPGEVINVGAPLVEIDIPGIAGDQAQKIAAQAPRPTTREAIDEKGFGVVGSLEVAGDAAHLPASDEGAPAVLPALGAGQPLKKVLATPVARAMARDLGIDIAQVLGTGPGSRVMKADIQEFAGTGRQGAVGPGVLPVEYQPLSQTRKAIARNMITSKHSAAHMTVFEEAEVGELVRLREAHKMQFQEQGVKLTYLPFILKAVARALIGHPVLNTQMDLDNNRLIYKKYYHINVAVDTDDGLVTPVIRHVDRLSIREIAVKLMDISDRARQRKLTLEDFKDGTFSVTNYGAIAGTYGVPVINYPQAAILGIGRIMKIPVVKDGEIVIGQVLPLSMSVDHRIVDGGQAARFILSIKEFLADPVSLLLG